MVEETVKDMTKSSDKSEYDESFTVFVSHSFNEDDQKLASILKNKLKEYDVRAYLAEKEKRYGYIISNKIREELLKCFCVVVILTKNSTISASVNQELGYAMGINKEIIPLVKDEVKDVVGVLLKDIEGEEFTDQDFKEKCKIIAEYILNKKEKSVQSEVTTRDETKFDSAISTMRSDLGSLQSLFQIFLNSGKESLVTSQMDVYLVRKNWLVEHLQTTVNQTADLLKMDWINRINEICMLVRNHPVIMPEYNNQLKKLNCSSCSGIVSQISELLQILPSPLI
ncbi:MAG: toll/interleukin-1 receptor domain-containing protein [Nitrosotalea sp.]